MYFRYQMILIPLMTKIKPRKMMKIWKVRIIEVAFGVRGLIRRLMHTIYPCFLCYSVSFY